MGCFEIVIEVRKLLKYETWPIAFRILKFNHFSFSQMLEAITIFIDAFCSPFLKPFLYNNNRCNSIFSQFSFEEYLENKNLISNQKLGNTGADSVIMILLPIHN